MTRDERFFCQRLYALANQERESFAKAIEKLAPSVQPLGDEWELAYEVCLYRDLRHFRRLFDRKAGKTEQRIWPLSEDEHSHKRTFDLCLFSESQVVIIEAKAQQGFGSKQLAEFEADRMRVKKVLGIEPKIVFLASSKYMRSGVVKRLKGRFSDCEVVTWNDLAAHFTDGDALRRADSLYGTGS
ncbi:MAG: hypothetical protein K0S79_178 [Nitrospira sp.]|nr:hypothetical protein [Nitrospira sp.]